MRKTFVIACGGTGGHLSPGIALAERLTDLGYRCVLIVSRKKIDARLLEKYPQLEFRRAPGAGLDFSPMGLLRFFCSQCSAIAFLSSMSPVSSPLSISMVVTPLSG